nr:hypothetical protein CTI12_AA610890 [Tanacetum cinerariifolium]
MDNGQVAKYRKSTASITASCNNLSILHGGFFKRGHQQLTISKQDSKRIENYSNIFAFQLHLVRNQFTSITTLPELSNLEFLSVAEKMLKSLSIACQPRLQKHQCRTCIDIRAMNCMVLMEWQPSRKTFKAQFVSVSFGHCSEIFPCSRTVALLDVSSCLSSFAMLACFTFNFLTSYNQNRDDDVKHMWNEWALRGLIVIRLVSHSTLTLLGNEQKYNPRTRVRMALFAYLLALAAASSALGVITRTALDEDNELSLRHFVEIVFQFLVALYIFLLSWPGCSDLPKLSVLVYLAGFIKCFGRIKALRLAKTENLRDSMLGPPDAGPNYLSFWRIFC